MVVVDGAVPRPLPCSPSPPPSALFARSPPSYLCSQVGRAVANKVKPTHTNAIFDSKVLSRSHAEIWADKGKVYIQDTKSSNGT